jgi:hypothetical protein
VSAGATCSLKQVRVLSGAASRAAGRSSQERSTLVIKMRGPARAHHTNTLVRSCKYSWHINWQYFFEKNKCQCVRQPAAPPCECPADVFIIRCLLFDGSLQHIFSIEFQLRAFLCNVRVHAASRVLVRATHKKVLVEPVELAHSPSSITAPASCTARQPGACQLHHQAGHLLRLPPNPARVGAYHLLNPLRPPLPPPRKAKRNWQKRHDTPSQTSKPGCGCNNGVQAAIDAKKRSAAALVQSACRLKMR